MAKSDGKSLPENAKTRDRMGFFGYYYFLYTVCTGLLILEPWERRLFHTIMFLVLAMTFYSTYIYLPYHASLIYEGISNLITDSSLQTMGGSSS